MFRKILIANRGEIALRIIRSCAEMGIQTVAVYSEADKESLHVSLADEAYCIGPNKAQESYLNMRAILSVAEISGSEAIHPGYGFLAENASFCDMCAEHGIVFIGPSSENITKMGDKSTARKTMMDAKIPVVPGSKKIIESEEMLQKEAESLGYPVMLKASAGGGGKGMQVVNNPKELLDKFKLAKAESKAAFNDDRIYIEKFIKNPRHIEIQILADGKNAIHLGERDCSIQRRHQKLVEEAPSPFLTDTLRKKMGEYSIQAAKYIAYKGAGTIEFLVDEDQNFYFMEMNTRIQVEHPVTEMIYGVDLIKEQIKIAATGKLSVKQEEIKLSGHAIEFRINAENPENNFIPSPGKIELYLPPGGLGVRVDSHAYTNYKVPPYYDSLVSKLIVHAKNRTEAIEKAKRSLNEYVIGGVDTTLQLHKKILEHDTFIKGEATTLFIDKHLDEIING